MSRSWTGCSGMGTSSGCGARKGADCNGRRVKSETVESARRLSGPGGGEVVVKLRALAVLAAPLVAAGCVIAGSRFDPQVISGATQASGSIDDLGVDLYR